MTSVIVVTERNLMMTSQVQRGVGGDLHQCNASTKVKATLVRNKSKMQGYIYLIVLGCIKILSALTRTVQGRKVRNCSKRMSVRDAPIAVIFARA